MSDVSRLFEGGFGDNPVTAVEAFVSKEWEALNHFNASLPADIKPLADALLQDTKGVLVDAAEWGGTALSAYITSNGSGLSTTVANLLSGALNGETPVSAAGQTAVQGVTKLLLGLVAHAVTDAVNVMLPQPPGNTVNLVDHQ